MKNRLAIFDLDDTLVFHDREFLKIYIRNSVTNDLKGSIPYQDYIDYDHRLPVLAKGFHYDFSDFECPYLFRHSAIPNSPMIHKLVRYVDSPDWDVHILTIRSNPTDKHAFWEVLHEFGVPKTVPIIFAGSTYPGENAPEKKLNAVKDLISKNPSYNKVAFYDDSLSNVNKINELKSETLDVVTYHVVNGKVVGDEYVNLDFDHYRDYSILYGENL